MSKLIRVIDTRLNNVSQLAGFTKRTDLEYFLRKIGEIEYVHTTEMAPSKDILDAYKKNNGDWETYEKKFLKLMSDRQIEKKSCKQHSILPDLTIFNYFDRLIVGFLAL